LVKEDQYTATPWLQKVLLHRQTAAWNDDQIITHFRNVQKEVIDWFDSLPVLNVSSQHVWQEIKN
jgi:hypothetical protein